MACLGVLAVLWTVRIISRIFIGLEQGPNVWWQSAFVVVVVLPVVMTVMAAAVICRIPVHEEHKQDDDKASSLHFSGTDHALVS
jgi:membrane protein YdbS with pleckstrin-like domain